MAEAAPCSGPMRMGVGSRNRTSLCVVPAFWLLTSSNGNDGVVRADVSLPAQLGFRFLDEHRTAKKDRLSVRPSSLKRPHANISGSDTLSAPSRSGRMVDHASPG